MKQLLMVNLTVIRIESKTDNNNNCTRLNQALVVG